MQRKIYLNQDSSSTLTCSLPHFPSGTYFSENALLPGLVQGDFQGDSEALRYLEVSQGIDETVIILSLWFSSLFYCFYIQLFIRCIHIGFGSFLIIFCYLIFFSNILLSYFGLSSCPLCHIRIQCYFVRADAGNVHNIIIGQCIQCYVMFIEGLLTLECNHFYTQLFKQKLQAHSLFTFN